MDYYKKLMILLLINCFLFENMRADKGFVGFNISPLLGKETNPVRLKNNSDEIILGIDRLAV